MQVLINHLTQRFQMTDSQWYLNCVWIDDYSRLALRQQCPIKGTQNQYPQMYCCTIYVTQRDDYLNRFMHCRLHTLSLIDHFGEGRHCPKKKKRERDEWKTTHRMSMWHVEAKHAGILLEGEGWGWGRAVLTVRVAHRRSRCRRRRASGGDLAECGGPF